MNTEQLTEAVARLRGAMWANDALMNALLRAVPSNAIELLEAGFHEEVALARVEVQSWQSSSAMADAFERTVRQSTSKLDQLIQTRGA